MPLRKKTSKKSTGQLPKGKAQTKSVAEPSTAQTSTQLNESDVGESTTQLGSQGGDSQAVRSSRRDEDEDERNLSSEPSRGQKRKQSPPPSRSESESNIHLDSDDDLEGLSDESLIGDLNTSEKGSLTELDEFEEEEEEMGDANQPDHTTMVVDEFPDLPVYRFNDQEDQNLTSIEKLNKQIFDRIIIHVNRLYMRKARSLSQVITVHRVKRPREFTTTFMDHKEGCQIPPDEVEQGRDQTRGVVSLADHDGINPLVGAKVEVMVDLVKEFIRQARFFNEEDCCEAEWLSMAGTKALYEICELLKEGLCSEKHKRQFWDKLHPYDQNLLHDWEEHFNLPETQGEKNERRAKELQKQQLQTLHDKQREVERQQEALQRLADEAARKIEESKFARPPSILTRTDQFCKDEMVYDYKTSKLVPVKNILDRISKGFAKKLFRDKQKQHQADLRAAEQANPPATNLSSNFQAEDSSKETSELPRSSASSSSSANNNYQAPEGLNLMDDVEPAYEETNSSPIINQQTPEWEVNVSHIHPDIIPGTRSSTNTANVLIEMARIPLNDTVTPGSKGFKELMEYVSQCEYQRQELRIDQWPRKVRSAIDMQYRYAYRIMDKSDGSKDSDWQQSNAPQLRLILERILESTRVKPGSSTDLVEAFRASISQKKLTIDWSRTGSPIRHPFMAQVLEFTNQYDNLLEQQGLEELSAQEGNLLVKVLIKNIIHENISQEGRSSMRASIEGKLNEVKDFKEALQKVSDIVVKQLETLQEAASFLVGGLPSSQQKRKDAMTTRSFPEAKKSKPSNNAKPKGKNKPRCKGCGWDLRQEVSGEGARRCPRNAFKGCKDDPRRNKTAKEWIDSDVGKRWNKISTLGLPKDSTITLDNVKERWVKPKKGPGKTVNVNQYCANLLETSNSLINFSIVNSQIKTRTTKKLKEKLPALSGRLLLDTGAIGNSVVSSTFYNKIVKANQSHDMFKASNSLTSAFNDYAKINKEICFKLKMINLKDKSIVVKVRALVADINVDLILDRQTIKANNLVMHFPNHFSEGKLLESLTHYSQISKPDNISWQNKEESDQWVQLNAFFKQRPDLEVDWKEKLRSAAAIPRRAFMRQQQTMSSSKKQLQQRIKTPWNHMNFVASACSGHSSYISDSDSYDDINYNKSYDVNNSIKYNSYLAYVASNFSRKPAFEREGNLTDIPDNKLESIPAEIVSDILDEAEYAKVSIEGPTLLRSKLQKLVYKHKKVFKSTVQAEAAKLKPFKLDVDESKWYTKENRYGARSMDREKATALEKMLTILVRHQVIEQCDDAHYSHAFLVPKPNGSWRLVLDFKNLNKATQNYYKWPLPEIKEMLNRIGDSRPKYFAVFDLTSGYYQAPIDESSKKYTAFTTRNAVYRWRRLPMGLTGAGSYFQHSLSTQVLQGLIHHGVELYLDDCMVHASSLEEFLERLEEVFKRFSYSGITLNPSKCKLGLTRVEYVGHTIDENGLHFTRSKLDKVLNFPRPETKKKMKSFIGLANYFRDHIANHSNRVQLLQESVANYTKRHASQKITWTPALTSAFEDIRAAIDNCPRLWFMDDFSPIFLQTDASDYGIGAYLFQRVTQEDESTVDHPIGFISKSIASEHTSWDTPMKEGYAIFYALKKWEYLLRDRQFTILTDHKNLTQLRSDNYLTNKMVKRWFMTYQEYDIMSWEYREGVNNEIPDHLSRLCPVAPNEEQIASVLFQLTGQEIPDDKWKIIKQFHSSESGHGGVERTMQKLSVKGQTWENMRAHVRQFIKFCPCCQKMDQMKKVIHSYPFTVSSYGLWETVSVDYIESLIPDSEGNNMIIVIVDNFSRFTDLYPAKSTNAMGAAHALLSFSGRYATPSCFYTDKGRSFANDIVKGLTESLGANHHFIPAYSKEQNAIVERQNKEVMRHLRNIVFDKRVVTSWSKYLPIVQRIINTSINSATGITPAEAVFPNGITLDRSLVSDVSPIYMSSYISELQQAQARIIAIAEQNLRDKDRHHVDNYKKERTEFPANSYVLAEHRPNPLRRGPKSKLLPFLRGPLLVKSHSTQGMYILQDLVTQKLSEYHMSRLRPFEYDAKTLTPLQVAVTDSADEFIVQECLSMRGDTRGKRTQLEFKIRWAGYGPEDDTWEPWEFVRDCDAVQLYLYSHPNPRIRKLAKSSFIPPSNRAPEDSEEEEDS